MTATIRPAVVQRVPSGGCQETGGKAMPADVDRRPFWYWRIYLNLAALFAGYFAVARLDGDTSYFDAWLDRLGMMVFSIGLFLLANRPRVRIRGDRLYVRGMVRSSSVPLSDIVSVRPGYMGLRLLAANGWRFTVVGVGERSNFSLITGRTTRADRLADEIREIVKNHRPG